MKKLHSEPVDQSKTRQPIKWFQCKEDLLNFFKRINFATFTTLAVKYKELAKRAEEMTKDNAENQAGRARQQKHYLWAECWLIRGPVLPYQ
jgi:hypothetical protein